MKTEIFVFEAEKKDKRDFRVLNLSDPAAVQG